MTREHARQEREAYEAFCDGKDIQAQIHKGVWIDVTNPDFCGGIEHRVKPAPRKVALCKTDLAGWVFRHKELPELVYWPEKARDNAVFFETGWTSYQDLMDHYERSMDGGYDWEPCWTEEA